MKSKLLTAVALLLALSQAVRLLAQESEPADSLVRLMSAQSVQMIQKENENIRKVIGPARFLHNDTYFLCDTAYWYVDDEVIKAWGNVSLMQENTVLTSDRLDYQIPEDLAQFRGNLVELRDKDGNLLRTRYLDYNTKDSVAVFNGGASMKDSQGQIIESIKGTYDSKAELFTFENEVNMFSDSIFVKTDRLLYHTQTDKADFEAPLDAWKEENMLSSDRGEYDRQAEVFRFYDNVHLQGTGKEAWADTLYFQREVNNIEMYGGVQIRDEERGVTGMGNYLYYEDSLSRVTLSRDAAVAIEINSEGEEPQKDTLYLGADRLTYQSIRKCDIPEEEVAESQRRLTDIQVDPVSQYREKAAAEAARKAEEAQKAADERSGKADADRRAGKLDPEQAASDSPGTPESDEPATGADSPGSSEEEDTADEDVTDNTDEDNSATGVSEPEPEAVTQPVEPVEPVEPSDSLSVMPPPQEVPEQAEGDEADEPGSDGSDSEGTDIPDEAPSVQDTTKVGFAWAVGNVKVYKEDMQARCDSLVFVDLDSLARMYVEPVIWNEGSRQYVADSLSLMVAEGRMQKANLMSNAFIVIQEDSTYFDQISSAEMTAYFDSTTALQRFDALGGAQAVFYIEENDALATVNKVNTKMLSAYFAEGQLDKIYYFESPKSDAYPTVQLPQEDRRMRGFKWTPEERPASREDITTLVPLASQRAEYDARPRAAFRQTDIYFPGYIPGIYKEIALRDSLARIAAAQAEVEAEELPAADSASVAAPADEAALAAEADSTVVTPPVDSTAAAPADSAWVDLDTALEQIKEAQKEPSKAELRRQAREERWAAKDARDAARAEAKAAKALEKERARKRKLLAAQQKQAAKDQKALERYMARYEKKRARAAAKAATKAAAKAGSSKPAPELAPLDPGQTFEPIREDRELLKRVEPSDQPL